MPPSAAGSSDPFSSPARSLPLRNLINTDELKTWLQDLLVHRFGAPLSDANEDKSTPRQAACQRWLLSVARKWIIRKGQTQPHNPSGLALSESPAWIRQAISNGTPPRRLSLAASERETLGGVLDWLRSDQGPSLGSDWSRISVEQAIRSETAWIDAMAKAALKKDLEAADAAGTTLFTDSPAPGPDGRAGWRWVQVRSPDALAREGALMRHCVGSYADAVASGLSSIYSLRDPDNKPRLTLETQQGKITQIAAFANQACPPELFPRVADFARAFQSLCETKLWTLAVSPESEIAGVFASPTLGLLIAGSAPPEDLFNRLASELSENNLSGVNSLPLFAALGWKELLLLTIPHASTQLINLALVKAAQQGRLPIVELLLSRSDFNDQNPLALTLAADTGHLAVVQLLLPRYHPDTDHSEALLMAAHAGHIAIVELLLPHSDPKADDSVALSAASYNGHLEIAQLLLPRSDPKANHSRALLLAATEGHLAMVELLLPHSDPNADDSAALKSAKSKGHLAIADAIETAISALAPPSACQAQPDPSSPNNPKLNTLTP